MKINLKSIIEIDKDYYINKAIYSKKLNKLKLNIIGEYDENIEKKLESYFSYVNLSLQFEKENKKETNSIDDFYESQPLPDYYETGYENPENLGENNEEKNQESKEASLNNQDIFDLPKIEEEKKEPSKNQEEEKTSSLRDLKKIELENMIENARNNKKNLEKKEIKQAEILKYGRNINGDLFKIEEIYDKKGMNLSIKGEIFGIDIFESKNLLKFLYGRDIESLQLGNRFELGVDLSGGEWQQLVFCRTLMKKNMSLLVLDEPNSGLDVFSEKKIYDILDEQLDGVTKVIVTHRLQLIDLEGYRIIYIEDGRICEDDNSKKLLLNNAKFKDFYENSK